MQASWVALVDAGVGCIILGVGRAACPADYKGVASMQHHFPGPVELDLVPASIHGNHLIVAFSHPFYYWIVQPRHTLRGVARVTEMLA